VIGSPDPSDLARFRVAIARRFGLQFDDSRTILLTDVLERRVAASGIPAEGYLERMESAPSGLHELRELARELTVGETYFFRHFDQFRAFAEVALPDRLSSRAIGGQARILSAGCSTGEEAYSLAILARERGLDGGRDVHVHAIDINPAALEKASRGRYASWSLRETPPDLQRRWFVERGREFHLVDPMRAAVTFEEQNLASDDSTFWQPGRFDIVFCRNVIMYFTPENAARVIERLTRVLAAGGYLFLGHAETLRGLSHDFHLRHTHGSFYYQRKEGATQAPVPTVSPLIWDMGSRTTDSYGVNTWVETIQRAADRIQTLADDGARHDPTRANGERETRGDIGVAFELLKKERFGEALELLGTFSSASMREPEHMLLRAVLLAHRGNLEQAEQVCSELLEEDDLSAGAHYVLALCAEGHGDTKNAVDHDQTAAYLEPAFAMPRVHLGLMARRAGDLATAERELGVAISLLEREESSRLLLFGGGFGRESLMALCRAELARLGTKS